MKVIKTVKEFNTYLSSMIKSAKTQRDNMQSLIIFGLIQYKEHQNLDPLSRLLVESNDVKSIPSSTIKDYIKAHANVRFVKNPKTKEYGFKKHGKNVDVTEPKQVWYEWSSAHQAKPDMDPIAQAKALLSRVNKALESGKYKGDKEQVDALVTALKGVVPA